MFEIVSRLVNFFLDPIVWVIIPMPLLIYFLKKNQLKNFTRLFLGQVLLFFTISSPLVNLLVDWHERKILPPDFSVFSSQPLQAVVALGGGNINQHRSTGLYRTGRTITRYLEALVMAQKYQVPRLLISRSMVLDRAYEDEATSFLNLLSALGRPDSQVQLIPFAESTNTYTESQIAVEKLKEISAARILLVTSALHMPRALRVYQAHPGFEIVPYPVDYSFLEPSERWTFRFENISRLKALLHEWLGFVAYKLTGKIL